MASLRRHTDGNGNGSEEDGWNDWGTDGEEFEEEGSSLPPQDAAENQKSTPPNVVGLKVATPSLLLKTVSSPQPASSPGSGAAGAMFVASRAIATRLAAAAWPRVPLVSTSNGSPNGGGSFRLRRSWMAAVFILAASAFVFLLVAARMNGGVAPRTPSAFTDKPTSALAASLDSLQREVEDLKTRALSSSASGGGDAAAGSLAGTILTRKLAQLESTSAAGSASLAHLTTTVKDLQAQITALQKAVTAVSAAASRPSNNADDTVGAPSASAALEALTRRMTTLEHKVTSGSEGGGDGSMEGGAASASAAGALAARVAEMERKLAALAPAAAAAKGRWEDVSAQGDELALKLEAAEKSLAGLLKWKSQIATRPLPRVKPTDEELAVEQPHIEEQTTTREQPQPQEQDREIGDERAAAGDKNPADAPAEAPAETGATVAAETETAASAETAVAAADSRGHRGDADSASTSSGKVNGGAADVDATADGTPAEPVAADNADAQEIADSAREDASPTRPQQPSNLRLQRRQVDEDEKGSENAPADASREEEQSRETAAAARRVRDPNAEGGAPASTASILRVRSAGPQKKLRAPALAPAAPAAARGDTLTLEGAAGAEGEGDGGPAVEAAPAAAASAATRLGPRRAPVAENTSPRSAATAKHGAAGSLAAQEEEGREGAPAPARADAHDASDAAAAVDAEAPVVAAADRVDNAEEEDGRERPEQHTTAAATDADAGDAADASAAEGEGSPAVATDAADAETARDALPAAAADSAHTPTAEEPVPLQQRDEVVNIAATATGVTPLGTKKHARAFFGKKVVDDAATKSPPQSLDARVADEEPAAAAAVEPEGSPAKRARVAASVVKAAKTAAKSKAVPPQPDERLD